MDNIMSIGLLIFGILFLIIGLLPIIVIIYRLIDEKMGNKFYAFPLDIKGLLLEIVISISLGIFLIVFHNLIVLNI